MIYRNHRLKLPEVTLVGIDCVNPHATVRVMLHAMRQVDFGAVVLATDTRKFPNLDKRIRQVHRVQTDRKVKACGRLLPIDYETDLVRLTAELFQTRYCLHMEWDSLLANPLRWTDDFFRYDYIGAPWPYGFMGDPNYPAFTPENSVGNGGFCLKSKAFCEALRAESMVHSAGMECSDLYTCLKARPALEAKGLKYAPFELAEIFSCEHRIYSGQFGAHGKETMAMNGWNLEKLIF